MGRDPVGRLCGGRLRRRFVKSSDTSGGESAADTLEPHRFAAWLLEAARAAHTWYHRHHVLGEPEAITRARLVLARATQLGLTAGLRILGLSAPERM